MRCQSPELAEMGPDNDFYDPSSLSVSFRFLKKSIDFNRTFGTVSCLRIADLLFFFFIIIFEIKKYERCGNPHFKWFKKAWSSYDRIYITWLPIEVSAKPIQNVLFQSFKNYRLFY